MVRYLGIRALVSRPFAPNARSRDFLRLKLWDTTQEIPEIVIEIIIIFPIHTLMIFQIFH